MLSLTIGSSYRGEPRGSRVFAPVRVGDAVGDATALIKNASETLKKSAEYSDVLKDLPETYAAVKQDYYDAKATAAMLEKVVIGIAVAGVAVGGYFLLRKK